MEWGADWDAEVDCLSCALEQQDRPLFGHVDVAGIWREPLLPSRVVRIRNNAEKFYVPDELLPRAAFLSGISGKHDDVLRSGVTNSVIDSWMTVKNTLKAESVSLPVTAEAMSAAKINAPQNY